MYRSPRSLIFAISNTDRCYAILCHTGRTNEEIDCDVGAKTYYNLHCCLFCKYFAEFILFLLRLVVLVGNGGS